MSTTIHYHRPGILVELMAVQSAICLSLSLDAGHFPKADLANVEFVFQPVDDRGLACGGTILVHSQPVALTLVPALGRHCGKRWLPASLDRKLIDRCHVRVIVDTMAGTV